MINTKLVDARNWEEMFPVLAKKLSEANLIGLDIETHNAKAHAALLEYKNGEVFDVRRTVICGLSLYVDGDDTAYYINIEHADTENRVRWEHVESLLDRRSEDAYWIIHNAPFEITMLRNSVGYEVTRYICTLQLAVSAYNDDEYDILKFKEAGLGDITRLIPEINEAFAEWTREQSMNDQQASLFAKVASKDSKAAHSYNGLVKSVRYGYGLKQMVQRFFGYKMQTYEETLGNKAHMGELTGAEAGIPYGAEDAYWAVQILKYLQNFIEQTNPKVMETYIDQELPMVDYYAEVWSKGWRVDLNAVLKRRDVERHEFSEILRRLKRALLSLLPFPEEAHKQLLREEWYSKNWQAYRDRVIAFAHSGDSDKDEDIVSQVSGAVTEGWVGKRKGQLNFSHYMVLRVLMYDLLQEKPIYEKGKIQSDGEARGKITERVKDSPLKFELMNCLNLMTGVEQRMKLYLTPYSHLTDPETQKVYPNLTSQLNSRRMAASFPNPMQLGKRGDSVYVRGFYKADPDHLLVSLDWSQIELVLIGDYSGDPEFAKAYSQIPYEDLHIGAMTSVLQTVVPDLTEELMRSMKSLPDDEAKNLHSRLVTTIDGLPMTPSRAFKYWRTNIGKTANFGYWYSGALSDVGRRMGWTSDQMWEATERYRTRFVIAEKWRQDLIASGSDLGYVMLRDGHRRTRYEATSDWVNHMLDQWWIYGGTALRFGAEVTRRIHTRAKNQIVNSVIQGSCATLAKRSIPKIMDQVKEYGLDARFIQPIHDELVFSVRAEHVVEFLTIAKSVMNNHPEIVRTLKMDCTASVGRSFEPWDAVRAPFGQIELDEAPDFLGLPKGQRLNNDQIHEVIDYLVQ